MGGRKALRYALALLLVLVTSGVVSAGSLTPIPVKTSPEVKLAADRDWSSRTQKSRAHPGHYDLSASKPSGSKISTRGIEGATLTPIPIKTSPVDEYTPAADRDWFSWAHNSRARPGHYNIYAESAGSSRIKVNARGTQGEGGGIDGKLLVYSQFKGRFAGDILKYNLDTHRRSGFPPRVNTSNDEFHPTISGRWILFTRYNSRRENFKVLLYNRSTGALRVLAGESGRRWVYSGQINGDYAVWGRVTPRGSDVFRYHIPTRTTLKIPRPVFAQYGPAVSSDGTIYYNRSGNGCGVNVKLVRYPVGGPARVLYNVASGNDAGYSKYVDDRLDGSLHLYYQRTDCRRAQSDIFKVIDSFTLTVVKAGNGTGTVSSTPTGIACGVDCSQTYHGGVTVTLTATPDPGSTFLGWSDPTCGTNLSCAVIIEEDESLTATFALVP